MHEIFFLSDILFTSCYFTCTCLVLEISLFKSIVVKHRSKSFSYLAFRSIYGQAPPITRVYVRCHGGQETIFEYCIALPHTFQSEGKIISMNPYVHYIDLIRHIVVSVPNLDLYFHWHNSVMVFFCSVIYGGRWLFVLSILVELLTITV